MSWARLITKKDLENLPKPSWGEDCDGWNFTIGCKCWECISTLRRFKSNPDKSFQRNINHLKAVVRLLQLRQRSLKDWV